MDPQDIERALSLTMRLLWRWEGLVLTPYLCSAGVPTIGLGTTRYPDGRAVTLNDPPITQEEAIIMARGQVRNSYMRAVRAYCPQLDTPNRLAAISSWTYNVGPLALRASTLRRRIVAGQWDEVPAELMRWNKAGGRVLRGLTARRQAEAELFMRG